jgi:hypothetical protein
MSSKRNDVPDEDDDEPIKNTLLRWLNVAVKLTVPIGAVVASFLTVYIQKEQSSRETNNQREQSESNLRATMFGNLISPLVGKDGQLDSRRYSVLVQLLALNFHEHFQFKPLMKHADDLLEEDLRKAAGKRNADRINWSRWSLRSVAHRVIDSQLALLQKQAGTSNYGKSVRTYWIYSKHYPKGNMAKPQDSGKDESTRVFIPEEQLDSDTCVRSPDGKDAFDIIFEAPEWRSETVNAHIRMYEARSGPRDCNSEDATNTSQDVTFQLTPFSFPFTDNLRLPNGNRIALFVRDSQIDFMKVQVKWFPENYDLPMELTNRE